LAIAAEYWQDKAANVTPKQIQVINIGYPILPETSEPPAVIAVAAHLYGAAASFTVLFTPPGNVPPFRFF